MINIKTSAEIAIMREGGLILAKILDQLASAAKPGLTTLDLDKLALELISTHNANPSFLGYDGFPASICTSINEEIVHGVPSGRRLKPGDLLKIDLGIIYKGFHTDSATSLVVGGNDSTKQRLIDVANQSLDIGISKARIGNTLGDIGHAIQTYVEGKGYNVIRDLVGHGIGKSLHEEPQVLNYGKAGTGAKLVMGMTLAIEPMVVAGKWPIKEQGLAFVTKDGSLAAHSEHTVAITDNEPLTLTSLK